jgi:hypothetical protein
VPLRACLCLTHWGGATCVWRSVETLAGEAMFKCFRASSILLASALAASGCASIPVIQVGLRTVIDLNREVLPERTDKSEGWVRLSTGQIVGSKSE